MNPNDAERNPFDPPRPRGLSRAVVLALAAHALLMLVLTSALRWNNQPQDVAVEAELWSPTVQRVAPPPAPPPPPVQPAPPVPPPPPPPPAAAIEQRDAEIALAQQRQRQAEQQYRLEQQRKEKELAEKKAAEEARRKEAQAKAEAEAEKKAETARRMDALRRMSALAASSDSPGDNERSTGPSGDYAALIRKLVRDKVNFPSSTAGNPVVTIDVQIGPTGEIISQRVVRPSGVKAWDDAVLRALERIQRLPSDKGRYWNPLRIIASPKE
jgi:colicin import membrane protein